MTFWTRSSKHVLSKRSAKIVNNFESYTVIEIALIFFVPIYSTT